MWQVSNPLRNFKRKLSKREEFPCDDCGLLTAPKHGEDEWYSVNDDVWEHAEADYETILCIGCLEARLGRQLNKNDFSPAILNAVNYSNHSGRLKSRLTAADSS